MIQVRFFTEQNLKEDNSYTQRTDRVRGPMLSGGKVCKRKRTRMTRKTVGKIKVYSIISVKIPAQDIVHFIYSKD